MDKRHLKNLHVKSGHHPKAEFKTSELGRCTQQHLHIFEYCMCAYVCDPPTPSQVFDGAVIVLSLAPMVASTVANGPNSPWDAISLIITLRIWRIKRIIDGERGRNQQEVILCRLVLFVGQLKEIPHNSNSWSEKNKMSPFSPRLYKLFTIQSNIDIDHPSE